MENHGPVKLFTYMYIIASTVKCTLESTVVWLICHFVALFVLKIKKIRVLVAKPELLISCHQNEWQSAACFPSRPPRQHRVAWETPKWADNLAGGPAQRHKKVAVSAHEKSRCRGDFVKSTLCSVLCRFVFSSLQIHVQFFADSCSVLCRFVFSYLQIHVQFSVPLK